LVGVGEVRRTITVDFLVGNGVSVNFLRLSWSVVKRVRDFLIRSENQLSQLNEIQCDFWNKV
jgi:hypothetical protein